MNGTCISNRPGPPAKKGKSNAEEFICDGNKSLFFRMIRSDEDLENDGLSFNPDMTHQVFGQKELVFGYKNLHIDLWYTACRLNIFFNLKYESKVDGKRFDGLKPDDINQVMKATVELPPGFFTDKEKFAKLLPSEHLFRPFGECIHSYTRNPNNRQFEIYKFTPSKESPEVNIAFREYHARLQTFLLFFVDGASYIDADDDRWVYYLIYEKYNDPAGNLSYAFAGYQTVYMYYSYRESTRPRISQVLILPPFQRQEHCVEMLRAFYLECIANPQINDVTVEDPSENYQRVRDYVDVVRAIEKLPSFRPPAIFEKWSNTFSDEAKTVLKINKRQARRIYELLRLFFTNREDPLAMRSYRLEVKRRVNAPFKRTGRDFEKLRRALSEVEWKSELVATSTEQRLRILEENYKQAVEDYDRVIERLHRQGFLPGSLAPIKA